MSQARDRAVTTASAVRGDGWNTVLAEVERRPMVRRRTTREAHDPRTGLTVQPLSPSEIRLDRGGIRPEPAGCLNGGPISQLTDAVRCLWFQAGTKLRDGHLA
jgi:hypothetical protein